MLDLCSIFHKGFWKFILTVFLLIISGVGGIVLWSRSFTPEASRLATSPSPPVNSLIREALIEGRTTDEKYEKDGYALKWAFANDLELIFVVSLLPTLILLPFSNPSRML